MHNARSQAWSLSCSSVMLEHPLATAIHAQLAFLLANLAAQLVITLRTFEPRQRYLTDIANTPVSMQSLAQLARHVVLMLGAQAQVHALTQVRVQVHLPVAQLKLPVQAHAIVVTAAVDQFQSSSRAQPWDGQAFSLG